MLMYGAVTCKRQQQKSCTVWQEWTRAQCTVLLPAARALRPEGFHCSILSPLNEPAAEQVGCLALGIRQHRLIDVLVVNPL